MKSSAGSSVVETTIAMAILLSVCVPVYAHFTTSITHTRKTAEAITIATSILDFAAIDSSSETVRSIAESLSSDRLQVELSLKEGDGWHKLIVSVVDVRREEVLIVLSRIYPSWMSQ